MRSTTNELVSNYLKKLKDEKNTYKENLKRTNATKESVQPRPYYDKSTLTDESTLKISNTINGVANKNETYKHITAVVFDDNSYNFHIFPNDIKTYNDLVSKFTTLQKLLKNHKHLTKKLNEMNANNSDSSFSVSGGGTGNNFARFNHIKTALKNSDKNIENEESEKNAVNTSRTGNLYKYLEVIETPKNENGNKKNIIYRLNFMRYTCDKNGEIGCTMQQLQFHKITTDHINKGKNGVFDICYTTTDQDGEAFINSAKNICYNPPVPYPVKDSENYDQQIDTLINHFVEFIEKTAKM